jgi:hypothetical protein
MLASNRTSCDKSEELAEADCGSVIVSIQVINDLVIPYLERFATDEQKKKYLAPLCSGEKIGAIAMTEPGAGADLAGIRTTALKNDEGNFVLNGSKTFISNGVQADFTLVVAITDFPTSTSSAGRLLPNREGSSHDRHHLHLRHRHRQPRLRRYHRLRRRCCRHLRLRLADETPSSSTRRHGVFPCPQ